MSHCYDFAAIGPPEGISAHGNRGTGFDPSIVHVRWLEIDNPGRDVIEGWRAVLDAEERACADRLRLEIDRDAYVAAHALTRFLLSDVGGLPPRAWRYARQQSQEKPRIHPSLGSSLCFSHSHTRGLVATAVAVAVEVGIDVEAHDSRHDIVGIADRFFRPEEARLLHSDTDDARRRETFLRLWTLKEAFVKATGEGLSRSLQSFGFRLDPVAITFENDDERAEDWRFHEERPTERHLLAVAARPPATTPLRFRVRRAPADLMSSRRDD